MAVVGAIREAIEHDRQEHEAGGFDFELMVWYDSVGLVVPFQWIEHFPGWLMDYEKFMEGRTACGGGVYHRDVLHFLNIIESQCTKD